MSRYLLAHGIGYAANVAMLYVFSDRMGLPHQAVQAAAIVAVAGMLFVAFRYFVFAHEGAHTGPHSR
jgi:putative flippase GtrA